MSAERRSGRILCVDDEPFILLSLSYILRKAGFEVVEGRNGQEALELSERARPQLVFLDVMMPILNGFEVCAELRARRETARVPIVLLTARGQEADRAKGFSAGATRYVIKPFSPAKILELARELLPPPPK